MNTRLSNLKDLLSKSSLGAALLSSVPDIIYLTNFASFSTHEREAFLLVTKQNNYIFTDARYSHAVTTTIENFQLLEIGNGNSFTKLLEDIITKEEIKTLGIDTTNLTVREFEKIKPLVKETKHFDLSSLRVIKTPDEIEHIQKACELGDQAYSHILKNLRMNITEKEVAYELENFIRKHGAEPSFPTIVAFEENAAIPHHKTSNRKLRTGNLILLDFGVQYENYCSDMTRTICFGKASEDKKKAHQTVLEAQQKAIEYCHAELVLASHTNNAGILKQVQNDKLLAAKIDQAARDYITSQGYPSIPHALGHGIGLEFHEAPMLSPRSKDTLTEGMVFSIEPGIYLNDKWGIRIEDLFAIENGQLVQLTNSPRDFMEI